MPKSEAFISAGVQVVPHSSVEEPFVTVFALTALNHPVNVVATRAHALYTYHVRVHAGQLAIFPLAENSMPLIVASAGIEKP